MKNKIIALCVGLLSSWLVGCKPEVKETAKPVEEIASANGVKHVDWAKNLGIYELNVRQYSQEGTLKKAEEDLERIKELGIGIIWLMPIHPISEKNRKGTMGSYYAVQDYKAVNPEFGTLADLQSFVKKAHSLGMYVILDWVANHSGWDNAWIESNPEFYTKDSTGNIIIPIKTDWTDVADLNYESEGLRKEMISALEYWVKEADIDGYRCDVASMVPTDFWNDARAALDKIKPVFMLAEAEVPEHHNKAFDMSYGWHFHHIINEVAKGKSTVAAIDAYINKDVKKFKEDDYLMYFTTNHDENSWNGTVFERMGDGAEAFGVLCFTFSGMPLVYSGQEAGMDKRLEFFEKDVIEWKEHAMFGLFQKLLALKKKNSALWNGTAGGALKRLKTGADEQVFAFTRQKGDDKVLVVINLSKEAQQVAISEETGNYKEIFTGETQEVTADWKLELPAWGYRVYELAK